MRVLFVGPLPEPITGQSLACRIFLDALRLQHDVDVVDQAKREFRPGITSFGRVREVLAIARRVSALKSDADLIYLTISESYSGNLKDLVLFAICFRQLPRMVIHLHGGAGLRRLLRPRLSPFRVLNAFFYRRIGGVVVLGESQRSMFATYANESRVHVVPNCAEDALFVGRVEIDRKFSNDSPLRLVFISNLLRGKGHAELLDAYLALDPATRGAVTLDFAGGFDSPSNEAAFRDRLHGLSGVVYHGPVTGGAKLRLFRQAHVFCLPTYYAYEGQPISILEAYAAGCAVITTDHSGIGDIFRAEVNGYLVRARSVSSLTAAIRRAAASRADLRRIALTNWNAAQAHYRVAHFTQRMMRLVDAFDVQAAQPPKGARL
jgi:glycosyltransferase involved in cell wall biosynthesis